MIIPSYSYDCVQDPCKFSVGKTIISIYGLHKGSECVTFILSDGSIIEVAYHQDCCASCDLLDYDCDESDLLNQKILSLEIVSSDEDPPDRKPWPDGYHDSFTWSFVKLSTTKGHFTMRWYGESNGYYSESPTIQALDSKNSREYLTDADLVRLDMVMELGL